MTTSLAQARRRRTPVAIGGGIVAGALVFLVLNWAAARWLASVTAHSTLVPALLLVAVVVGGATYLAIRNPEAGLYAGATLAVLVMLGLLLGGPRDVSMPSGVGSTPGEMVRHGAQQTILWACAAAVLAASLAGRKRH